VFERKRDLWSQWSGRIIFWPDSSCERVLFLLAGFVAIDGVKDWVKMGKALADLGIGKGLSSCEAGGYSGGSVLNFCGCFVNLLLEQDILGAGRGWGDGDLINLNLDLYGRHRGKWRRLNERHIFYLNFTFLWFSNVKERGVNGEGVKVFGSAKLEGWKSQTLWLEDLCLDIEDMCIARGGTSGINMEQIRQVLGHDIDNIGGGWIG
jgi:hypothetical protein